jgi:hypothetical protein
MSKIVYQYNDDGLFIGEYSCQESPLEPGIYLIPQNATEIPPLPNQDGYYTKFINGAWHYVLNPHSLYQHKMNMLNITNVHGVPINFIDENGEIKPYSEEQMQELVMQSKKEILRALREPLLKNVDHLVNQIVLGDLSDYNKIQVSIYRRELLDITNNVTFSTDIEQIVFPILLLE